ncbi:MAG: acyl-CoA reductase, partial [Acidobacteriota bacterium]
RTLIVHAIDALAQLPTRLAPWRGSLQGVARLGARAEACDAALRALGVSRLCAPRARQTPDGAAGHNGGLHPLDAVR